MLAGWLFCCKALQQPLEEVVAGQLDGWDKLLQDEREEWRFYLREEFDMNVQDLIGSECDIADEQR